MSRSKAVEKHAGGRPTILTPELQLVITDFLKAGCYVETATSAAGISRETYYAWLRRGSKEPDSMYGQFSDTIKKALAEGEMRAVALVSLAAQSTWQAAAWMLERRYPERWGRRKRKEVHVSGSLAHIPLSPEEEEDYRKAVGVFFATDEDSTIDEIEADVDRDSTEDFLPPNREDTIRRASKTNLTIS